MYKCYPKSVFAARQITGKPLTHSGKVLYTHFWGRLSYNFKQGVAILILHQSVLPIKMRQLKIALIFTDW
ncbi:hypothetical protein IQ37_09385 [Chryseobacterium piperi]|uniref:Uncharacterized protein n=1 Tax=Chryseobacterium piperi TaxID=558152 RepID=A0A086BII0_9FLAO|nr:hypothetical protein [Chryseobacterium piperi]ASW75567.1 hypothetical protein CJF12_15620 [Chryseobacterium piperi]KFF28744.1 hypothetical protein IQ37_09385 [Chryseobacterium piperi]